MNPAIVIPVYKEKLSEAEKRSVINTLKIFRSYPVVVVCPEQLHIQWYDQLHNPGSPLKYIRFSGDFFKDINGYNRLLLTPEFYQSFADYSHILICQPDAWVFDNQLDHWMNQPYDYFGAPIVDGKTENGLNFMPYGGNGGFSLRKVKSHLTVLNKYKVLDSPADVMAYYRKFHKGLALWLRFPLMLFRMLGYKNNSKYYTRHFGANEDMFWSKKAAAIDQDYKPAPFDIEISFAFEKEPVKLYELNGRKLPFGCHAWERYAPDFWKTFIH